MRNAELEILPWRWILQGYNYGSGDLYLANLGNNFLVMMSHARFLNSQNQRIFFSFSSIPIFTFIPLLDFGVVTDSLQASINIPNTHLISRCMQNYPISLYFCTVFLGSSTLAWARI